MRRFLVLLIISSALCPLGVARGRKPKPAEVQVLEATAKRENGLINVDARVKNVASRPMEGLVLIFRFDDAEGKPVTTQRLKVDEPTVPPGEESSISAQLRDAPYAVSVHILATDAPGHDLKVSNDGPFPVDE